MTTTPNPVMSAVPGAVVPGATPGTTPPILPGGGTPDPSQQVSEMTKRLLATLAQASQRKQFAGTPVPGAIQPQQDMSAARSIGMNTANPRGWGLQRFAAGIQTSIQNAVSQQKQQKLNNAEADWTYLQSALNEKYAAEASKDPKAIAAAQQKVDVVMSDPKKLKDMAKALNQDWLNPEKTTIYGEALKKVSAKTKQTEQQTQQADAQKQQAAQGLKGLFQKLLQKNQQPQLTDEQKKQMGAEIEAKAPTTTTGMSAQEQREAALGILDLEKAAQATRENYTFQPAADGKIWAINKTNPRDAYVVQDSAGKELTGGGKGKDGPAIVNGVPIGMYHGGKLVTPDMPNWTKTDAAVLSRSQDAARTKDSLKVNKIIRDEIGPEPDPAKYELGIGDPQYTKDLASYGKAAEEVTNRMASARARAAAEARYVKVADPNNPGQIIYMPVAKASKEGMAADSSASVQVPKKVMEWATTGKGGEEINSFNTALQHADLLKEAAIRLQNGDTRWLNEKKNEFKSAFGDPNLTSAQAIANAYSREITKMLSAGHMTDSEISSAEATLPLNANLETIEGVLDAYKALAGSKMQQRYNQYQQGLKGKPNFPADAAATAAGMETQTYNGATYQRKKGSQDQWTLAPAAKAQ